MFANTDIDIDFADRDKALENLIHIPAVMKNAKGIMAKHISGVYFQNIPTDPITGNASIPYGKASELGYFKIDFLNNSIYEGVRDEEHLNQLLAEPEWSLFEIPEIVGMLSHVHDHFGIVQSIRPKSVEDLAVILALMRPGKRYLVGKPRVEINAEIWKATEDGSYQFKRSHAISYALSIVMQLNLLVEKTEKELDDSRT